MALMRATLWWAPALLLLIAVGVVLSRDRVAAIGGLGAPYPDAAPAAGTGGAETAAEPAPVAEAEPGHGAPRSD